MSKQATKKPEQKEAPPSSSDVLASLMEEHKGDHFNDVIPVNRIISTGSLKLDSFAKVRSGGVVRLVAKQAESGKTSQAFVFAANFMARFPKTSKTIYVKSEGRLSPEIQARSGLTFVNSSADWKPGTVFVLSSNIFDMVANTAITLLNDMFSKGEQLCLIVDSLDGLITKEDKLKGITNGVTVASVAKLTKLLFRHIALPITHYDALVILTSQYSTEIKLDQYTPTIPRLGDASGGSSVPHQSDYILQYWPRYGGDFILENPDEKPDSVKNKIIGIWATVEFKKSATDVSGNKVKIPIKKGRVGSAIWVEKEVGDMLIAYELVKKSGSWLSFDAAFIKEAKEASVTIKEKVQGLNGLYEYIESDRAVFEWLYAKFRKMLGQEA